MVVFPAEWSDLKVSVEIRMGAQNKFSEQAETKASCLGKLLLFNWEGGKKSTNGGSVPLILEPTLPVSLFAFLMRFMCLETFICDKDEFFFILAFSTHANAWAV